MAALPRAILFDLDETLISFGDRSLQFREVAEAFGAALTDLCRIAAPDRRLWLYWLNNASLPSACICDHFP